MTLIELEHEARRRLWEQDVTDTPDLEARLLMQKATGLDEVGLITHRFDALDDTARYMFGTLLGQRLSGRPMAYILGHRGFYDLDFTVDERVLIPQPDTETLVEDVLRTTKADPDLAILDLCTGSGCIGITLAKHLGCHVTLSDLSEDALKVAGINAKRWLDEGQYTLVHSDLFEQISGTFDLIVSNPPYLTKEWIKEASEEVRREPVMALDGLGRDGLAIIRRLASQVRAHLAPSGRVWIECDYRQAATVRTLLLANGCLSVYIEKDLAGKDRVVVGATDHVRAAD
ncbi:MAG: peptide chain release factor N(5)-glutamine methyltransferase [Sphaerochaetaceae bacterium]|nr:peptide chain release factor N(5)-glutamine methyltransferase [Spirochaetales bacterium]MDY5499000.1 peptide chain release factor N(5)-glutamine methyltransferase [Sphaerochaetaceae bacterium]